MKTKIFVTVGSTYPFDRLIKQIEKVGENKKYDIFAQVGKSELKLKNIKYKDFLDYERIQEKINWADVVISHAGVGTIIDCLSKNKKIMLFPRLKKYEEAIDDHQEEICKAFKKKYDVPFIKEKDNLSNKLQKEISRKNKSKVFGNNLSKSIRRDILE